MTEDYQQLGGSRLPWLGSRLSEGVVGSVHWQEPFAVYNSGQVI
jgi:hypothetical protein